MIFDTDIFIWVERGNKKAAKLMENEQTDKLGSGHANQLIQQQNDELEVA